MNLEQQLTKRHKEWVNIVRSFGVKNYAEDIVQEMYVRVLKYIREGKDLSYNNDINYFYIYQMLKHMTINLQIKQGKVHFINIDDYVGRIKTPSKLEYNIQKKYQEVNKKLDSMFWYDAKVYRIIEGGTSIKELSEKSKISYYSLYRTYNKVKKILKELI